MIRCFRCGCKVSKLKYRLMKVNGDFKEFCKSCYRKEVENWKENTCYFDEVIRNDG